MSLRTSRLRSVCLALDILSVLALLLGLTVFFTGGFREWLPWGRVSLTSWERPVILALIAVAVRHWLMPRPTLVSRLGEWRRAVAEIPGVRSAIPVVLSTRTGVLLVGFLAVALFGYRADVPVPWRVVRERNSQLARAVGYGLVYGRRQRRVSMGPVTPDAAAEHRVLPGVSDADALRVAFSRTRADVDGRAHLVGVVLRRAGLPLSVYARAIWRRRRQHCARVAGQLPVCRVLQRGLHRVLVPVDHRRRVLSLRAQRTVEGGRLGTARRPVAAQRLPLVGGARADCRAAAVAAQVRRDAAGRLDGNCRSDRRRRAAGHRHAVLFDLHLFSDRPSAALGDAECGVGTRVSRNRHVVH